MGLTRLNKKNKKIHDDKKRSIENEPFEIKDRELEQAIFKFNSLVEM